MLKVESYIEEKAKVVHSELKRYMENLQGVPQPLKESMTYSLLAGGKRLRPILVLASAEAVGGKEENALPFACAVEMIHTYSLIHDDLPAMDDDDFRRGNPTNHKVYGEAMAILAGDALLTKAFGIMTEGLKEVNLPYEIGLDLLRECSIRVGAEGMVGGQVKDILAEGQGVSLETLQDIHRSKTGDLITFSIRLGAVVGGAKESELHSLTGYAERLGLAFQIQDDILDVIGDQNKIGKPVGSDEGKNKSTYPALLGLEASKEWVQTLVKEAKDLVVSLDEVQSDRLLMIADYLTVRDK
ncbi:polyprenyl synthetase family protein [Melghirimyces algeriensis]|uniref:Farnesyl diphosphate synthase n=1 Tax=Melghirimyces algeriensis TaxID=910412 RepID=A0A521AZG9_9BACL|nr:farnesyl diphosphate synthase [Melghirimyces algeriensis]SMO40195.1 farnesyl-diphosphate synthase [Melghirimyces algeriensis]